MLDFTSVLYLGMHHAHEALRPWRQMTTGRPAALGSPVSAERLTDRLALLIGCETAVLGTSTLHLFWDLFDILASDGIAIHVDAATYPIARWGIERVAAKGVPAAPFGKHDPAALQANLRRDFDVAGHKAGRPIVVTDGLCPFTGRPAPLREYARIVREYGGLLVVDDTQGLGLFGTQPTDGTPFGNDGAGTLAWCGVAGPDIIVVSSLAKAFGAPLAVIAGSRHWIDRFKIASLTRVHCSPPSMAAISAAENALAINAAEGSARRSHLLELVLWFRRGLRGIGLSADGGLFPFQTLKRPAGRGAIKLHAQLLQDGVRTVLRRARHDGHALVTFIFNCRHTTNDIAKALRALERCCAGHLGGAAMERMAS
jgi:8-amino-7-oxononanoate synthase